MSLNPISTLTGGTVGEGDRLQRIYTPSSIAVGVLGELWPEGVLCDPCSGPDSLVPALIRLMPPQNGCRYDLRSRVIIRPAKPKEGITEISEPLNQPGLERWPPRTYLNPDFDQLKGWIAQFVESWECVMLTPVRPHRRWWRALLRHSSVCWLDPVKFAGYAASFPAPLALCYRGDRDAAWRSAASKVGEVI